MSPSSIYDEVFCEINNDCKPRLAYTQPAFTCSKLTIETLEQGEKYMFKVNNKDTRTTPLAILDVWMGSE